MNGKASAETSPRSGKHAGRCVREVLARLVRAGWLALGVVARLLGPRLHEGAALEHPDETHVAESAAVSPQSAGESISLPKPRESTAISEDLRGGELTPQPTDLQGLLVASADFVHNSGR